MANVRQDNVQIKLEIDGSQSRTELDNLSRKSKLLQEELKGLKKGTQEYVDKGKELATVTTRMGELQKEIGLTSLNSAQLTALSRQLNRELALLTPNTQSFLDKAKELGEVDNQLAKVRAEAKGVKDQLEDSGNGFLSFVKKSAAFAGIQLGVEGVVSSLKQLGSESITAAAEGSDSIADMEKSLNVTTAGAKALRTQLEGIDTRTAQEDLEGIAIAGGQLGVAAADVDEFTVSVDQAVVALGDEFTGGVEDVTKSIGGLQKLFKDTADLKPDQAITKIGSALNALGADGSATAPVVAEFAARIGQLGDLAPEISQTLGLGAAFQELGLSAEISSGGLTNVLLTASKDTAGFAKQLGLTQKEFIGLLNSDPNEVILQLAESLKGASNTEIISTLEALGVESQEATKVVSLLATQTDLVRQKQALASAEMAKGTSLTEEFNKKNTNAAAEIAKAEKSFAQYRRELGEQLIPIYIAALQYSGLFLDMLRGIPAFVRENSAVLKGLALALLALNAEQIILNGQVLYSITLEKARAVAARASAIAFRLLGVAMSANPLGLFIAGVALLIGGFITLYERSEGVRKTIAGLGAVATQVFATMKDTVLTQLRSVGDLLAGIFTFDPERIKKGLTGLGDSFNKSGKEVAAAYHKGYAEQEAKEKAAQASNEQKRQDDHKNKENKAAADRLEREKKAAAATAAALADAAQAQAVQNLKLRELALQRELIAVQEGSEQELKLKKQLVLVARDIELSDAKKTANERVLIQGQAQLALDKLNADFHKKQAADKAKQAEEDRKLTEKQALEEAEAAAAILKRQAALERDEYVRRAAELRAAAEAESVKLKGNDAQVAEQRRLIQEKLQLDLLALEEDRVTKQAAIDRRIEQSDADIALRRVQQARDTAGLFSEAREQANEQEFDIKKGLLQSQLEADLANEQLTVNERLAIIRQFHADVAVLEQERRAFADFTEREKSQFALQQVQTGIQIVGDFQKIDSDKQLAKLEKDKKARLLKLDQEYKAGMLSKEQYEAQKSSIEANYDAKTRSIKKQAAEKEKEYKIAQAIIAGVLAVIEASPNVPLQIATGIAAAAGVAKIIATPIPEFAKGGITGAPNPTWREKVRRFASGGINAVAGVANTGQLHGSGGIQMIDGATGQQLGEWERGEPYMILSRDTYANNKPLIDDLLDTSLHRGGAPVRPRGSYYEDGGTLGGNLPSGGTVAGNAEQLQVARETRDAIRALPTRLRIAWEDEDTENVEERLGEREAVRNSTGIR
ncbi:hypothetical protein I2I05_19305 [Hymenobacter sp. BT683]|uniref:Phage tail tape measure protein n=1 Tax=Hymenobacter jeongseonensis TaxID=2791027 RepID=A0ABS0IMF1_9BACT|nr:hypothetical protein [Hymenobacter jeongseonensis]MBF9239549.1 hypothetical protein [Hymenobacter jeongseonensis]